MILLQHQRKKIKMFLNKFLYFRQQNIQKYWNDIRANFFQ